MLSSAFRNLDTVIGLLFFAVSLKVSNVYNCTKQIRQIFKRTTFFRAAKLCTAGMATKFHSSEHVLGKRLLRYLYLYMILTLYILYKDHLKILGLVS